MGSGEGDLTTEDVKEDREFRLALLVLWNHPQKPQQE